MMVFLYFSWMLKGERYQCIRTANSHHQVLLYLSQYIKDIRYVQDMIFVLFTYQSATLDSTQQTV